MSLEIDAHHHFWQRSQPFDYRWLDSPALAPIRRDFLPTDLAERLTLTPIRGTILVQTQHDPRENAWALGLADRHPFIAGVVGWVDLASERCEEQLLAFRSHPKAVGIRHVTQDEPDDDFIVRPDVLRGLGVLQKHGVPFDLLFYIKHLRHAATLARALPTLPMVIDHMAKPRIKEGRLDDWLPHLREAARYPNVFCKLSGMATEADWQHWTARDFVPYVRAALEAFGAGRCMYGSDWPVCELACSHKATYDALDEALGPISDSERRAIFGGTAARFYGVKEAENG